MRESKKRSRHFVLHGILFLTVSAVVLQGIVTVRPLLLFTGWAELLPGEWESVREASVQQETPALEGSCCLTLALKDIAALPACRVLVNGEEAGSFENRRLTLSLMAGDLVEVDTTFYDFPVTFEIVSGNEHLLRPQDSAQIRVQRGIGWLGEVRDEETGPREGPGL